jgi:hypothetical protein
MIEKEDKVQEYRFSRIRARWQRNIKKISDGAKLDRQLKLGEK